VRPTPFVILSAPFVILSAAKDLLLSLIFCALAAHAAGAQAQSHLVR